MEDGDLREPDEMFWNSPLKWIVPILFSIVIGFLIYGLQKTEQKNKEKLEKRELEK